MTLRVTLIVLLIAIAYLSLTPKYTINVGNDKIGHFIAYGVLMTNIGLLTIHVRKKYVYGILLALVYGILMEIGQHFVPGRFFSIGDMLANAGGVTFGIIVTLFLSKPILSLLKRARLI